jgi:hypothetical protein
VEFLSKTPDSGKKPGLLSLSALTRARGDFQWKGFIMIQDSLKQIREMEMELLGGLKVFFRQFGGFLENADSPRKLRMLSDIGLFGASKAVKTLKRLVWAEAAASRWKSGEASGDRVTDAERYLNSKIDIAKYEVPGALLAMGINRKKKTPDDDAET